MESHWLIQILQKPVWLAGMLCSRGAGWILQAIALDKGPLMVVQAVTTLPVWSSPSPSGCGSPVRLSPRRVVLGALAVVAGIIVFLSVGSPHEGTTQPSASTGWTTLLVIGALMLIVTALARAREGAMRAFLFGSAAGFGFALQTAVTKQFDTEIGSGVLAFLADWSVYVLVASAVAGFVLQQSALKTGVLAPAMASSNAVSLFVGVIPRSSYLRRNVECGIGACSPGGPWASCWPSPARHRHWLELEVPTENRRPAAERRYRLRRRDPLTQAPGGDHRGYGPRTSSSSGRLVSCRRLRVDLRPLPYQRAERVNDVPDVGVHGGRHPPVKKPEGHQLPT